MELTSESDIWKRHAKSCTKSPNLKRIMTNNNSNSSFSFLPGPGFKNKLGIPHWYLLQSLAWSFPIMHYRCLKA